MRWFAVIATLLGCGYAFLLPPLQAPDEYGHLYRAYTVSTGACVNPSNFVVPYEVRFLAESYPEQVQQLRRITLDELLQAGRRPLNAERQYTVPFLAVSIYSCVPYLPAATAMAAGRIVPVSALGLMYLGRLANLFTYIVLVSLALWVIPNLRIVLFLIALMPMTLHQAASLSPDSLTNGVTFLLTAVIFHAIAGKGQMTRWESSALAILTVVVTLCKANIWTLLALVLIPKARFPDAVRRWLWVAALILLAVATGLSWQYINRANVESFQASRDASGIDMAANARFIWQHPGRFLVAFWHALDRWGYVYLRQYTGDLGWFAVPMPPWIVLPYLGSLVVASLSDSGRLRFTTGARILLGALFAGAVISTFALLWIYEARWIYVERVIAAGRGLVPGVQGRYFIPVSLLLFAAISGTVPPGLTRHIPRLAGAMAVTVGLFALWRIVHTYY